MESLKYVTSCYRYRCEILWHLFQWGLSGIMSIFLCYPIKIAESFFHTDIYGLYCASQIDGYMEVLFASLAYLSPVICCNLYSKKYVKSAADIFCIIWNQFHMVQPHQSTFILVFSKCFLPLPFISQKRKTSDKYVRKCLNLTQIWYYSQSIDCGCGVVQDLYPESNHPKRKPPVMYMFKMYYINMIFSEKYFCCLFIRAIPGQMTS